MKTLNLKRSKIVSLFLIAIMIVTCIPNISVYAVNDINTTNSIDQMLLKSQQWLNNNYSGKTGFVNVPEDGTSRRSTVNGCIRALQIELGITATAANFGQGTISRFNSQYPNGVIEQDYPSTEEKNIYGIIQCALWTKGYSTGANIISKHFYGGTGNAIINLKTDMGFQNVDSTVTLEIMKSLLSMDYYVTVSGGSEQIRQIQQELNRNYSDYLGIIPCDGLYTRSMNKALIIVLQAIEGYSVEDATGNFGTGTKNNLPLDLSYSWTQDLLRYYQCVKLVQYALCCNGYGDNIDISNTQWDTNLSNIVKLFQGDLNIAQTGKMNVDTWMALLLSKGNPDRSCIACDTRFPMTQERINYLKNNGYNVVGRYLTGSEKGMSAEEAKRILDNGLSFFPIFQETLYTDTISKYNSNLGISDANKATTKANELGIPKDTIIYYAIDFDPTDYEIQTYVIPYFQSIYNNRGNYKVGVYGTRNVCQQITSLGYAETCFVSDMSTGYSGNMGFKIPSNWNLDQFAEIQVTTSSGSWDLDKVSFSEKFPVVTGLSHFKLGEFELTGYHEGQAFSPYKDAKRLRYTIICSGDEIMNKLHTSFSNHIYSNSGQLYWNLLSEYYFYEFQNGKQVTSNWIEVSDLLDYRFSYKCEDMSKPIYNDENPSMSMFYEDGTCNIEVYIEIEY